MIIDLQPGRLRLICMLWLLVFALFVGHFWLGNAGSGLMALVAWPMWQRQVQPRMFSVDAIRVKQAWMLHWVVGVVQQEGVTWVFADELSAEQFCALRRLLIVEGCRQPVGLRMSS